MKNILLLLITFFIVSFINISNAQDKFEQRPIEEALNPDGTLREGVQGSFKVKATRCARARTVSRFLSPKRNTRQATLGIRSLDCQMAFREKSMQLPQMGKGMCMWAAFLLWLEG